MKSPFPGMDPFIEAHGLWTDFQVCLIVKIETALNERLPAGYEALLSERTYIDVAASVSEREPFIEIRHPESDDRVVTCLEVLSPTNKRPGSTGWAEYEQ